MAVAERVKLSLREVILFLKLGGLCCIIGVVGSEHLLEQALTNINPLLRDPVSAEVLSVCLAKNE